MVRVFPYGLGDQGSIPGQNQRFKKWYLMLPCLTHCIMK